MNLSPQMCAASTGVAGRSHGPQLGSAFTRALAAHRRPASPRTACQAAVRFPAALPLLPFTPQELLPPGSCKVLRLYEPQYNLLLEEILSSHHQMFVHTAVAPADEVDAQRILGAYATGNYAFYLSTIIKVIEVMPMEGGVLLRVQAEGRVAVKSLLQSQPYVRALVVPITDDVSLGTLEADAWQAISQATQQLKDLMRDVQNLANKFKSPETSNLQRAMQWCDNPSPLVFSSGSALLNSPAALAPSSASASAAAAAASGGGAAPQPLPPGSGAFQAGRVVSERIPIGSASGRPTLLDLERSCRLSMAAIQPLPRCTDAEVASIKARQREALLTQDVLQRLQLALEVMGEARGLLSAKCALMSIAAA